jgi:membrane protein DedA with SNARE-associated domain
VFIANCRILDSYFTTLCSTDSMLDSIVGYLQALPLEGIILAAFLLTLIENIFPPSPSDILLVFIGSLINSDLLAYLIVLLSATAGSTLGFFIMFMIGSKMGHVFTDRPSFLFMKRTTILKAEQWFRSYGTALIIANRFLSGTRAVISFVAGASDVKVISAIVLSAISALIWNGILLWAGNILGEHWRDIAAYLEAYGRAITPILLIVMLGITSVWWMKHKKKKQIHHP